MSLEGNAKATHELRGKLGGVLSNVIDNTLSIEGAAADAKATGDAIALAKSEAIEHAENQVNGLTAEDVGAAPGGYGLGAVSRDVTASTINSAKANGWYRITGACNVTDNSGATHNLQNGMMFVHSFDINSIVQRVIEYGGTSTLSRKCYGGTWDSKWTDDRLESYPVGAIYISTVSTSPASLFGGTWTQLKDRFLLGAGSTYTNGKTGGSATHTLKVTEIPSHSHILRGVNPLASSEGSAGQYPARIESDVKDNWPISENTIGSTGGGTAHNNMPPYLVVYMWKRTA